MHQRCIVCKVEQPKEKYDKDFKAFFCGSDDCTEQLQFGWGSIDNARQAFRLMYARPDGTTSDVPLIWFPMPPVPDTMYTHVRAAQYDK